MKEQPKSRAYLAEADKYDSCNFCASKEKLHLIRSDRALVICICNECLIAISISRVSGEPPKPEQCYKKCGDTKAYNGICLNCGSSIVSGAPKSPDNCPECDEYKEWRTKNPVINKFLFENHRHDASGAIVYDEAAVLKLIKLCGVQ
jgi:hypothetical protein